ncbi:electron transfer flavoprotein regulatory factor 1 [Turdus rufiventris]|nr:electron transfer flavoprotein regulatory factor 1 [Turdus rufiventris]
MAAGGAGRQQSQGEVAARGLGSSRLRCGFGCGSVQGQAGRGSGQPGIVGVSLRTAGDWDEMIFKLLYLGREYPKGADYFRSRLKAAFLKNKDEKDPEKIKQLIARGEFVIKELEALYFLRKYRAMKQRYYSEDKP